MVYRTTLAAVGLAWVLAATPALLAQGICSPAMDGDIARQIYKSDAEAARPRTTSRGSIPGRFRPSCATCR